MVNSQLKHILSTYNAEHLYSVSECEYAYICGRGIHFHNFRDGTSRMFWPPQWDASPAQQHDEDESQWKSGEDSSLSTRDLFRAQKATSTPNISSSSHVSGLSMSGPSMAAKPTTVLSGGQNSKSGPHSSVSANTSHNATSSRVKNHMAYNPFQNYGHELNAAGTNVVAFNTQQQIFAVGEKKVNPAIHIFDSKTFQLIVTLKNATMVELRYLNFSFDGKSLVSLGSLPDYTMSIWDVETGEKIASSQASSQTTRVTFDPRDSSTLCSTGGDGHLVFWRVSGGANLRSTEPKFVSDDIIDTSQELTHTWGKNSDLFIGAEDGDILYFGSIHTPGDLMSPDQIEGTEPIRVMTVSKYHLITGSDDGILRFYTLDTKEFCRQVHLTNPDEGVEQFSEEEMQKNPNRMRRTNTSNISCDICSILFQAPFDHFFVGCADGSLFQVQIQDYSNRSTVISDIRLQELSIESKLIIDSHCGSVNGLGLVGTDRQMLATCGEDGTVRLWNFSQSILKAKLQFNASFTALKTHKNLVFVGSTLGYLRVIDVSSLLDGDGVAHPEVIFWARLRDSSVKEIDIDENGNCIVRFSDDYVAVLILQSGPPPNEELLQETHSQEFHLQLAGFICSDHELTCIKIFNGKVFVANEECNLMLFTIPNKSDYGAAPDYLLTMDHQNKWKLDYPVLDMIVLPENADSQTDIVGISMDKSVKYYELPASSSLATINATYEIESHLKANHACISLHSSGKYVATSADDGVVWIRNLSTGLDPDTRVAGDSTFLYQHNPMEGGIKRIAFGSEQNPDVLFSCGGDGTVFMSNVTHEKTQPDENDQQMFETPRAPSSPTLFLPSDQYGNDSSEQKLMTFVDNEEENYASQLTAAEREAVEKKLAKLREEFENIRKENNEVEEDEVIPEEEFIMDNEYVSSIEKVHQEQIDELKEKIKVENMKKEILTQRITEECFSHMEKHSESIAGLYEKKLLVSNYSVPKVDEKKQQLLKKIRFMRRVEEVDLKARRKFGITRELEGGVPTQTDNQDDDGDGDQQGAKRMNAAEEDQIDEKSFHRYIVSEYDLKNRSYPDVPSNAPEDILYNSFDLYTRQRKVAQMWLLHGQIQDMKLKFNNSFKEVQELKDTMVNKIDRVNSHISDIVEELDYHPNDYVYTVQKEKKAFLTVHDDEVEAEKWIDPEEKRRREEEERRKKEALENSKQGEIIRRALDMMMDGRLEDKSKKKSGIEEISKPACLSKPEEELSDAEKKEIQEYENAVKAFQEEETKKRKQQEAKLKNAQNDITDTCGTFDEKLRSLFAEKLKCDRTIYELELSIVKLAQSILDQEDNVEKQKEHQEVESQLEQQNTDYVHTLQQFEKTIHEYAKSCDETLRNIGDLERGFKESIINYIKQYQQQRPNEKPDYTNKQEVADRLARLYPKSKSLKIKVPTRQEFMQMTQTDPYPYSDIDSEQSYTPAALNQQVKRPDFVVDWLWSKFLEMRREKINMEYSYVLKVRDLEKRKEEEQRLRDYTKQVEEIISRQIKERNKFNERALREQFNLDYMFSFKQGQLEVEQQAVVTDYGDAILISKQNIVDLNRRIIHQAKQNIEQMRKIMDLSKKVEQINWENEALHFEADDMEDIYQRFQRLRVTKEMQSVLKTGHNNQEIQERDRNRLVDQIQHTQRNRKQRIKEKKKIVQKISKNVDRTSHENATLSKQLSQLQHLVKERSMIHELQSSTAAKDSQEKKMKQLRTERRLKDLSKAQRDELEHLQQTIQTLRERTFPSFSLTQKK